MYINKIEFCEPFPSTWNGGLHFPAVLRLPEEQQQTFAEQSSCSVPVREDYTAEVLLGELWAWVAWGFCLCVGQGLALLASIPVKQLVMACVQIFTGSLQFAPRRTVDVSQDWGAQQVTHSGKEKEESGKTHYCLMNTASHRHSKRRALSTPCLSDKSKSVVKYEMFVTFWGGSISILFYLIHLFTQQLGFVPQILEHWLRTGIQGYSRWLFSDVTVWQGYKPIKIIMANTYVVLTTGQTLFWVLYMHSLI